MLLDAANALGKYKSYSEVKGFLKIGTIEQNLPQPLMVELFGLSGRSKGPRGQRPLVRELRHNIRLG